MRSLNDGRTGRKFQGPRAESLQPLCRSVISQDRNLKLLAVLPETSELPEEQPDKVPFDPSFLAAGNRKFPHLSCLLLNLLQPPIDRLQLVPGWCLRPSRIVQASIDPIFQLAMGDRLVPRLAHRCMKTGTMTADRFTPRSRRAERTLENGISNQRTENRLVRQCLRTAFDRKESTIQPAKIPQRATLRVDNSEGD